MLLSKNGTALSDKYGDKSHLIQVWEGTSTWTYLEIWLSYALTLARMSQPLRDVQRNRRKMPQAQTVGKRTRVFLVRVGVGSTVRPAPPQGSRHGLDSNSTFKLFKLQASGFKLGLFLRLP